MRVCLCVQTMCEHVHIGWLGSVLQSTVDCLLSGEERLYRLWKGACGIEGERIIHTKPSSFIVAVHLLQWLTMMLLMSQTVVRMPPLWVPPVALGGCQ